MEDWKSQIVISNSIKMGVRKPPFAFTQFGVAMLSSVLSSETAIETNIEIMRAFVEYKHLEAIVRSNDLTKIQAEISYIKNYVEEILEDQNEINESTRAQLDAISTALAELQAEKNQRKQRNPIGFILPKKD